jgi:GT2 family glycosyltransferase
MHSESARIWDDILLQVPDHLTDNDSWHGHISFAFWCIAKLQPRVFVELGTQKGDSYCAFCQAVEYSKAATLCYAVDSWREEPGGGLWGEDIYTGLCRYHNPRYGHFSRLIRASSEEGLSLFTDGSIDLLHIAYKHTYEAVKAEYQMWRKKVSQKGIILFHGINARQKDSGVARFWEEITRDRPYFTFLHSCGLGVLGEGPDVPQPFLDLLGCDPGTIRFLIARLAGLSTAARSTARLAEQLREIEARKKGYETKMAGQLREIELLKREQAKKMAEIHYLKNKVGDFTGLQEALARQKAIIARVENSWSWAITAPLRGVAEMLRRIKQIYRRQGAGQLPSSSASQGLPDSNGHLQARTKDARQHFLASNAFQLRLFLESGSLLSFPPADKPKVSILLVLYNQAALTYACLRSILETVHLPYEVVVVDNASSDETVQLLSRSQNAKILSNNSNLHFLRGCNQALQHLQGEYLLFLNNDACLMPGALEAAVRTLENTKGAGAVGGRIVTFDGRLQEAGSLVWPDGSCLGYGRGADPSDPEYTFRRDVDFCSGAFLLTRRELFVQGNGFDTAYAPAYYEDADYCLRLRKMGYRVIYEPGAVIVHYEYGSSSSEKVVDLMTRNQKIFREKHSEILEKRPEYGAANVLLARYADLSRPRVLYVDDWVPHYALGAGFPRANEVVRAMVRAGANVTVFPTAYLAETWETAYRDIPREAELILGATVEQLADFLSRRAHVYNLLWVSRPHNMQAVRKIQETSPELFRGLRVVYDAEAIFALREQTSAALRGEYWAPALLEKKIAEEVKLAETADSIVSVSAAETEHFRRAFGAERTRVLGHAIRPDPTTCKFEERRDILFVGAIHGLPSPNGDSVLWFCKEIWPLLVAGLKAVPTPDFVMVGPNGAQEIADLATEHIKIYGQQPSLRPFYDSARIFIAPTRFAAGLPLKVVEAAANGVPVVASGLVAKQLGWVHGKQLLVADTPEEFARCCVRLFSEKDLWLELRAAALQSVAEEYGRNTFDSVVAAELARGGGFRSKADELAAPLS